MSAVVGILINAFMLIVWEVEIDQVQDILDVEVEGRPGAIPVVK